MIRFLCAIRGHAGVDANGFCKKCRGPVDCLPRPWRKAAQVRAEREVQAAIGKAKANSNGAGVSNGN